MLADMFVFVNRWLAPEGTWNLRKGGTCIDYRTYRNDIGLPLTWK